MYLEISGRQTGKTTRLINQIYADKNKYDLQILMGMNFKSLKAIKKQIIGNNKVKICLSYESLKNLLLGSKIKRVKLYVDEFLFSNAFCNNFKDIQKFETDYNLISNGYFSSSLNSEHYIILYDMQVMNNQNLITVNITNKFML